jgi:hypothetical protein
MAKNNSYIIRRNIRRNSIFKSETIATRLDVQKYFSRIFFRLKMFQTKQVPCKGNFPFDWQSGETKEIETRTGTDAMINKKIFSPKNLAKK